MSPPSQAKLMKILVSVITAVDGRNKMVQDIERLKANNAKKRGKLDESKAPEQPF